jgi:hypothetical protein
MSPQLTQVLTQVRQLSIHDRLELIRQLSFEETDALSWAETLKQMEEQALASGQVEQTEGGLVVKSQAGEVLDLDLVEFIKQQREDRSRQVMGL